VPPGHVPIDNFLTVPIVFADTTIGLLSVANSEHGYDEGSISLLTSIAGNLSPILNAQLQRKRQERERKQAEEELRIASDYNRSLIEVSLDPLVTIDADGKITDVNIATEKITGHARGELIGTEFPDYFTEPERARSGYQLAFQNGSVRDYPLEIRRRDGDVAQVLYNASVYRNNAGEPIGVFAAARDITERKRAEEALLKLSIAVEQSPVSIVITDTNGTIEFVNPKFTQLTGYENNEILGRNPRFLKSGETPPETYRKLWGDISSGKVWQGVFHNRKKNGEIFLEFATIAPVKNPQGVITNYIAIKEDITERRSLESQLRQSQKMEAIGTLAGGVAHDFNNILTAIIGFSSLLEIKMAKDDPLQHNVVQILAAADRAAKLTRSLLAFSRNQQIEAKVVDLNDIVVGLEKMLHRLIREDIDLKLVPAGEPLSVLVDAGQIEQVLINLVTNARDAMPDGGSLSIAIGRTALDEAFRSSHGYGDPGEYALLVVADNGAGMEEGIRSRVFDPFFTTKEVGKGTGLGLSVCYGIVKQHGGYINCYSEPGSGTTFRIYLPLVPGETSADEPLAAVHPSGGTETILLAEDDPTVRTLTVHILREFGYRVIEACDGEEAVELFRGDPTGINLCLFDVIMPKKRGWEAFEAIRDLRPDARVLFMSGYQANFDRLNDLTECGAGFITKPVVPRELLRRVRELLDG
jgi:PAS domain S-box-containing protein